MRRSVLVIILCAVVIVLGTTVWLGLQFVRFASGGGVQPPVVTGTPALPSVMVLPSAPDQGKSKHLAIGFAQALAGRIHCAPTCITQQYDEFETDCLLSDHGITLGEPLADPAARTAAERLCVDYLILAETKQSGRNVTVRLSVYKAGQDKPWTTTSTCPVDRLAKREVELATLITNRIGLNLTAQQKAELAKPNFSNPAALKLYGQSRLATSLADARSSRTDMLKSDPQSLFASLRYVNLFAMGPTDNLDIQASSAESTLNKVEKRYPANSQAAAMKGAMLVKQYHYCRAGSCLLSLTKADPDFGLGHALLAAAARRQWDDQLALIESRKSVELWPRNAFYHAGLAKGYWLTAGNARRGAYYNRMSPAIERKWSTNTHASMAEAQAAVNLQHCCIPAWKTIIVTGRELGKPADCAEAFSAMREIDPNNLSSYVEYAFTKSSKWGGSDAEQMNVVEVVRQSFGGSSAEARIVEAAAMRHYVHSSGLTLGGRYQDDMLLPCKWKDRISADLQQSLALVECRNYMLSKRRGEMRDCAAAGYAKWRSPIWQFLYGTGCAFQYEDKHDSAALATARDLFSTYTKEVPYDPRGYIQWGWCLSHQGYPAEAKQKFLRALELDPNNESAKNKLQYVQ